MEIDGNICCINEYSTTLDKIVKLKFTSNYGYSRIIYDGKAYKPARDYGRIIFYSDGEYGNIKMPYEEDKNYKENIKIYNDASNDFFSRDIKIDYSISIQFTLIAGDSFSEQLKFNATCPNEDIDGIIKTHLDKIQKEYTKRIYDPIPKQHKKYI